MEHLFQHMVFVLLLHPSLSLPEGAPPKVAASGMPKADLTELRVRRAKVSKLKFTWTQISAYKNLVFIRDFIYQMILCLNIP